MSENAGKNLAEARVRVVVSTGERERWLTLDNRAAYRLEQRYGSFKAYLERMVNGAYMETVSAIFSLCWGVSEDEALDLIVGSQFKNYFAAISQLIGDFLGAEVAIVEEAPAKGEGGPGAGKDDHSPGIVSLASRSSSVISTPNASGR
jgi:hypothetical protein